MTSTAENGMTVTLTFNEWFAIANALDHTAVTYRPDSHGVDLHALADGLRAKYHRIAGAEAAAEQAPRFTSAGVIRAGRIEPVQQ